MTEFDKRDPLRDYLESLPLPEPSNGLFERVERTRTRRRRVRHTAVAAAAMLVIALGLSPLLLPVAAPPSIPLAGQAEVRDPGLHIPALRAEEAELRLIDRQLAAAYRVSAPEGHIDTLWQRRNAVIQRLEQEPIDERTVVSL